MSVATDTTKHENGSSRGDWTGVIFRVMTVRGSVVQFHTNYS